MNRRMIVTIVVVVLCIGLLFAIANIFQRMCISLVFPTSGIGVILVGVWMYMTWVIWKKQTKIFNGQMESEKAERQYKKLKALLIAAGLLLLLGIIGAVGHNALYAMKKIEESVFFFTAIVGLFGFVLTTIGGLIYYFTRRKAT
ncbi:MAG TPA: hypothetical protein G4O15_11060 [Dehalococcoidia bacterium]|nr:hypothetical protein [Dehalococcoidia bacterium]